MKILILVGSRDRKGKTARTAEALLAGACEKGNRAEVIFLTERKIEHCRQCNENGWGACREQGKCVIDDEFSGLVEKINGSDAVAFATPVYFSDLSESMRAFLDRLRRICMHEKAKAKVAGKKAIGICVAGGSGFSAPECTVRLEKVLRVCGFDVVDMLPVRRQNLKVKLENLKSIGKWLAAGPPSH